MIYTYVETSHCTPLIRRFGKKELTNKMACIDCVFKNLDLLFWNIKSKTKPEITKCLKNQKAYSTGRQHDLELKESLRLIW